MYYFSSKFPYSYSINTWTIVSTSLVDLSFKNTIYNYDKIQIIFSSVNGTQDNPNAAIKQGSLNIKGLICTECILWTQQNYIKNQEQILVWKTPNYLKWNSILKLMDESWKSCQL